MGVVRVGRTARRPTRKNVKGRRPWSRTLRTASDTSYRSTIPRIRNPDFGFPDKLVTSVRYCDVFSLSGAGSAAGANVFRMNSLFDPDLTGVGHQPMYYDQLCGAVGSAPYSHYRVLGSKITCRFAVVTAPATLASNFGPVIVGLQSTSTSGLYGTTISALLEASNSTTAWLMDKTGGNNVKTLTATYVPSRDQAVDEGDDTIAANYNANPANVFYAIPWKIDTAGLGTQVQVAVEIDYRVEFYDRNEVAQS